MKIAIFCENRYKNNNQFNKEVFENVEPYFEMQNILGEQNCITYDLLGTRDNRDEFIILGFIAVNIFSILKYIQLKIKYRKNRIYLFLKEPPVVEKLQYSRFTHMFFDRIYTWDDNAVDNKKYFKTIWQQSSRGGLTKEIPFKDKKLAMLINGNKFSIWKNELYSEREKAIRFFEQTSPKDFDLYGTKWNMPNLKQKLLGFTPFISYKGRVPDKFSTLANYKFNICYENMRYVNGYITEKIWDSFKAKSVPIYLGAENITSYVPRECFIDFREFEDYHDLLKFLKNMDEKTYSKYIKNIGTFMQTPDAKKWFCRDWAEGFIKNLK